MPDAHQRHFLPWTDLIQIDLKIGDLGLYRALNSTRAYHVQSNISKQRQARPPVLL